MHHGIGHMVGDTPSLTYHNYLLHIAYHPGHTLPHSCTLAPGYNQPPPTPGIPNPRTYPTPLWTPLLISSGHRNTYGWQAVGTHPPGMLSCIFIDEQFMIGCLITYLTTSITLSRILFKIRNMHPIPKLG